MSIAETLELIISGNATGAISALEGVAQSAEKNMTAAEGRIEKFQKAGAAMLKTGFAGIGVGGFLTQLGSKEEEASASLKASVQSVGQSYDELEPKIEKAESAQARYGHTNVDAAKALSTLTLATGDTQKALDLMQVTADYAAKKGISLADAGATIGKIFNGSTKPLREFGIKVKENADGTKDYAGAVDELGKKLTGQADASVDSWSGKLKILAANAENFVSTVGEKFGPAILGVSTGLTALGGVTQGVSGLFGKLSASHAASALAAQEQATAEAEAAAAVAADTEATLAAIDANAAYVASGGAVTFTQEEVATATLARQAAEYQALLGNGALIAGDEALVAADSEVVAANEAVQLSFGPIALAAAALAVAVVGVYKAITDGGWHTSIDVQKFAAASDDAVKKTAHELSSLGTSMQRDVADKLVAGGAAGVGALVRLRDAAAAAGDSTAVYDQALADAKTAQANLTSTTDAGNQALGTAATATGEAASATSDMAAKEKELKTVLSDATDALNKQYDALHKGQDLQIDALNAIQNLTDGFKDNGATLDINTQKGRDNIKATEASGKAIEALIQQRFNETGSIDAANQAGFEYIANLDAQLKQAGLTDQQIRDYNATLNVVPASVNTVFSSNVADATQAVIELQRTLAGVPPNVDVTMQVYAGQGVRQFAEGGYVDEPVGKPVPAIIHGGEYVLTAAEVSGMRSGPRRGATSSGSGAQYNLYITAGMGADGAQIGQQVVEAIRVYERANGTAWRAN